METKNSLLAASAVLALTIVGTGVFSTDALSRGMHGDCPAQFGEQDGMGRGMGMDMPCAPRGFSEEQLKKFNAILDEYRPKLEPLRENLFVKRQELNALENAAQPDIKAVREAAEEFYKLRMEVRDLHQKMRGEIRDKVGVPANRHHRRPMLDTPAGDSEADVPGAMRQPCPGVNSMRGDMPGRHAHY